MTVFEMVKYRKYTYPQNIPLRTAEISAHFDIKKIECSLNCSLHTEYSYGKRKLDSSLISKYTELTSANKNNIPQLWKNELWALQFADFISELISENKNLSVIEIHPPFNDYSDINKFINIYSAFEYKIKSVYPNTDIFIENRCGSIYRGGKFVISKLQDLFSLCEYIVNKNLSLKIAYDVPQIYTAHNAAALNDYLSLLEETKSINNFIGSVHLWGKRLSKTGRKVSHCGDLNSYFGDVSVKHEFLSAFKDCFNDDSKRKMVLEVNSGESDLLSIIKDLQNIGIIFI